MSHRECAAVPAGGERVLAAMAGRDQEPAGSRGQRPRSAAPRKGRYLSRALTMILVLAWIPAPARAQDVTTSESTLRSTGKDPGPEVTCDPEEEYRHGTLCCLRCPPGTRVIQPCAAQGTLGVCAECPLGQYAQDNRCWPCTRCREDQEMLIPCHWESDARCGCKAGRYCEGPDCAACRPCRTSCPEGEELLQGCTDTADIVCGAPPTGGPNTWLWPILIVLPVLGLIICIVRKCRCSRARSSQAVLPRASTASEGTAGQTLGTENKISWRREEEGGETMQGPQSGRSENSHGLPVSLSQPLTRGDPSWVGSPAATVVWLLCIPTAPVYSGPFPSS